MPARFINETLFFIAGGDNADVKAATTIPTFYETSVAQLKLPGDASHRKVKQEILYFSYFLLK